MENKLSIEGKRISALKYYEYFLETRSGKSSRRAKFAEKLLPGDVGCLIFAGQRRQTFRRMPGAFQQAEAGIPASFYALGGRCRPQIL